MDQFTVTFDASQVNVDQIQATVKNLGFKPRIVKASSGGSTTTPGKMTPPLKKALAQAQTPQKLVLVKFSAHWCGPCKKMSEVTYSDAGVKKELSRFVVVEVDVDKDSETAKTLKIGGVPTFVVMSPKGSVLTKVSGFKTPAEFLKIINAQKG